MSANPHPTANRRAIDPITLEVIRHRLWMINDEQGKVAIQISGSPTAYESKDLNSSIMTAGGDSLFVGVYTTRVALCADVAVKYILERFAEAPGVHDGDAFITNDPWAGAGHQNDFMVLAPIFGDGELVAWTGIAMHDVDVGGPVPGNFTIGAKTVFDEAPLIPPIKFVEGGAIRPDIEALVLRNSRTPELNALNLRARLAACNRTRERIGAILAEYGKDVFLDAQQQILALVRRAFLRRLAECPDGTWRAEGYVDHDGTKNELFPIRVALTKQGGKLTFDYAGTSPQVEGPINCTAVGLRCGVVSAVLSTLCFDMPWAPGALGDILDIRAPEGAMNNARYPAAVGVATISGVYATQHVAHAAIAKMLASSSNEALRLEAQANWASSLQVTGVSGPGRGGVWFAAMLMDQAGGGGACLDRDGPDSSGSPGSPSQAIANIETYERQYPLLYVYRKQCRDTGGAGKFRGGVGTESLFITHGIPNPLDFTVVNHGASHPESPGLFGGLPGSVQVHLHLRGTDLAAQFARGAMPRTLDDIGSAETVVLAAKDRGKLAPGDALLTVASGGGGFGDPLQRDASDVAQDVARGICAPTSAEGVYGVIVDGKGGADQAATATRRRAMLAARLVDGGPVPERIDLAGVAAGVGGCFATARHRGHAVVVCPSCGAVHGPAGHDPKQFALCRELEPESLSEWNRYGAKDAVRVFAFYCRGCGRMIGSQVRKTGEPAYWDLTLDA